MLRVGAGEVGRSRGAGFIDGLGENMRGRAEAKVLLGFLIEPWVGVRHAPRAGPLP